jgi:uncharacterized BrkB/YihY/UPF0761 family membrane protein
MAWIYTSWIIVLAGMQIVWYLQSRPIAVSQPMTDSDKDSDYQMPIREELPRD